MPFDFYETTAIDSVLRNSHFNAFDSDRILAELEEDNSPYTTNMNQILTAFIEDGSKIVYSYFQSKDLGLPRPYTVSSTRPRKGQPKQSTLSMDAVNVNSKVIMRPGGNWQLSYNLGSTSNVNGLKNFPQLRDIKKITILNDGRILFNDRAPIVQTYPFSMMLSEAPTTGFPSSERGNPFIGNYSLSKNFDENRSTLGIPLETAMYAQVIADIEFNTKLPTILRRMIENNLESITITFEDFDPTNRITEGSDFLGRIPEIRMYYSAAYLTARVNVCLDIPQKVANWITLTPSNGKFLPAQLYRWFDANVKQYNSKKTFNSRNYIPQTSSLQDISLLFKQEQNTSGDMKLPVNEDNLLIRGATAGRATGRVYYCPPVDNTAVYIDTLRNQYNATTGEVNDAAIPPISLLADPYFSQYSYVNEVGNVQVLDLTGSIPLDEATIGFDLSVPIASLAGGSVSDDDKDDATVNRNFINYLYVLDKDIEEGGVVFQAGLTQAIAEGASFNDIALGNVENLPPDYIAQLQVKAQAVLANWNSIDIPESAKIQYLGYIMVIMAKYLPQGRKYQEALMASEKVHSPLLDGKPEAQDLTMDNLAGLSKLFPHQVRIFRQMSPDRATDTPPKFVVLQAAVGAGKTAVLLRDILSLIPRFGPKKRAFLPLKNRLIGQWYNEIKFFSQGRVNPYILSVKSLQRLGVILDGKPKVNLKIISRLISTQPKNTIFLVSIGLLRHLGYTKLYAGKKINRYPIAELFREFADYVGVDESQFIKNPASSQTRAINIMAQKAKFKRLASGTVIHNTQKDLIGQIAFFNPRVLKDEEEFFRLSQAGPEAIRRQIDKFVMSTQARKSEWAPYLPRPINNTHIVNLTLKQQDYNNRYMANAVANDDFDFDVAIAKEKERILRLRKKSGIKHTDFTKEELDEIEEAVNSQAASQLNGHFQAVELFCAAPDEVVPYVTSSSQPKGNDLISPKVAKIEEIVREHFAKPEFKAAGEFYKKRFDQWKEETKQYQQTRKGKKPSSKPPRRGEKVLVFCSRRKTPDHIFRHLSPDIRSKFVTYKAGDAAALEAFLYDPNVWGMIATEATINFGLNLQNASRIIRIESVWTPGADEQAKGRIHRPDMKNEFNNRKEVFFDWIITDNTLEVTKAALLQYKILARTIYDEVDSPNARIYQGLMEGLSRPKMSLKYIVQNSNYVMFGMDYNNAYTAMNTQLNKEADSVRRTGIELFELDPNKTNAIIPGSEKVAYLPPNDGIDPHSIYGTVSPVTIVTYSNTSGDDEDGEGDDDKEVVEEEEIITLELGNIVQTAYGVGRVVNNTKGENSVWIEVPNAPGEPLVIKGVPKNQCYFFDNQQEAKKTFARLIRDPSANIIPNKVVSKPISPNDNALDMDPTNGGKVINLLSGKEKELPTKPNVRDNVAPPPKPIETIEDIEPTKPVTRLTPPKIPTGLPKFRPNMPPGMTKPNTDPNFKAPALQGDDLEIPDTLDDFGFDADAKPAPTSTTTKSPVVRAPVPKQTPTPIDDNFDFDFDENTVEPLIPPTQTPVMPSVPRRRPSQIMKPPEPKNIPTLKPALPTKPPAMLKKPPIPVIPPIQPATPTQDYSSIPNVVNNKPIIPVMLGGSAPALISLDNTLTDGDDGEAKFNPQASAFVASIPNRNALKQLITNLTGKIDQSVIDLLKTYEAAYAKGDLNIKTKKSFANTITDLKAGRVALKAGEKPKPWVMYDAANNRLMLAIFKNQAGTLPATINKIPGIDLKQNNMGLYVSTSVREKAREMNQSFNYLLKDAANLTKARVV